MLRNSGNDDEVKDKSLPSILPISLFNTAANRLVTPDTSRENSAATSQVIAADTTPIIPAINPRDILLRGQIDKGGHAVVYRGLLKYSEPAAVKIFSTAEAKQDYLKESALLEFFHSKKVPNIVAVFAHGLLNEKYCIIMPFLDRGSLKTLIHEEQNQPYTWQERLDILLDVLKALNALHELGYVHLDVKSDNVLINEGKVVTDEGKVVLAEPKVVLADFGNTKKVDQVVKLTGTPGHIDPILDTLPARFESDMFSFGVLLWEMSQWQIAYKDIHNVTIKELPPGTHPELPDENCLTQNTIPPNLISAMRRCWDKDPAARPSAVSMFNLLQAELDAITENTSPVGFKP